MTQHAKNFLKLLVEVCFPRFCCGCGRINTFLCHDCFNSIDLVSLPVPMKLEKQYISEVRAAAYYHSTVRSLVRTLKYDGVVDISYTLAHLLHYTTQLPACDFITAVPIHPSRLKTRGFNQSALIGQELAVLLQLPYIETLERIHFTQPQAETATLDERTKNVANQFALKTTCKKEELHTKKILIVDDVCTTGSTLNECARVLSQAGAVSIFGCTIAHGG